MKKRKNIVSPLASFNYHLENYNSLIDGSKRKKDISQIEKFLNYCYSTELSSKIDNEDYDALVLTDPSHQIVWVNDGFKKMTGYSKNFAIGKRPSFLQGDKTSTIVKSQLYNDLVLNHTFEGSIINYRRNGELYLCHLTILPVYNLDEKLTYYLAIEKDETTRAAYSY